MAIGPGVVSLVLSFRNEAENISELVSRVDNVFLGEPEDYEVVFVNDDSTDNSLEILLQERKRNPRIRIVNMTRCFGVYECMLAGMEAASGDAMIYMDADLQDPPEIIPKLLSHWRAGADVVHTVRSKRHGENPLKTWITKQAYRLIEFGSTIKLPVEAGDFKLLSRQAADRLLALKEYDPYFRGLAVWVGGTQTFVPYEREARHAGKTQRGLFSRYPSKVFVSGITSFSFLPIYAVAVTGLLGLALALLLAVAGTVLNAFGKLGSQEIWLYAILTFFWGTSMAAIGTVGIYIVRIYKDVRGRPRYLVREKIGFAPPPQDGQVSANQ